MTAITPLPTPPSRSDPTNFATRGDAFLGALPDFATEMNLVAAEVTAASAQALAVINVTLWVSGTSYTIGQAVYSPITFLTYRRKTNGAGTTDPSADATNWALVVGVGDVTTTGIQTLTNKTLNGAVLNDGYTEEVYAVVDAAGVALTPNNGSIQTWTLGASRTPTQGTWAAGQSMILLIDDGSAFTVTWTSLPVTWKTNSGTAPTLNLTGLTVIALWKVGTTIYGARVGDA